MRPLAVELAGGGQPAQLTQGGGTEAGRRGVAPGGSGQGHEGVAVNARALAGVYSMVSSSLPVSWPASGPVSWVMVTV